MLPLMVFLAVDSKHDFEELNCVSLEDNKNPLLRVQKHVISEVTKFDTNKK